MITDKNIKSIFTYDSKVGVFYWTRAHTNRIKVGSRAGYKSSNGYREIRYLNKTYLEHRLAWLYVHERWPNHQIDHINGGRDDNRLCNLREATAQQNTWNAKTKKIGGGLKGAYFNKRTGFWHSEITKSGKRFYLGSFSSEADAHGVYVSAAKSFYGDFAPYL